MRSRPLSAFDALIDELHAFRCQLRDQAACVRARQEHQRQFTKSLHVLDQMYAALPKRTAAEAPAGWQRAETIAKAHHALAHDNSLTPAQRGELMVRLGAIAERVDSAFVKSHPLVEQIDSIRDKLDGALASGHAGRAEPLICELLKLLKSGRVEGADHARLSLLLSEIRQEIEETHNGSQG